MGDTSSSFADWKTFAGTLIFPTNFRTARISEKSSRYRGIHPRYCHNFGVVLTLQAWKDPEKILGLAGIAAFGRTEEDTEELFSVQREYLCKTYPQARIFTLTIPGVVDISSTELREKLKRGELTAGHARAILVLKSDKKQQEAAKKILALGMSVRAAETLCKNMAKEKPVEKEPEVLKVDYVAECEKSLSKHLGRGVKIINGKRKGKFELEFYGQEDLQNLLDALMKLQK